MISGRNWNMLGSLSTICPLNCDFCFRKGASPDSIINTIPHKKSVNEIEKLCIDIKYHSKEFDFFDDIGEYFSNPDFFSILKKFRQYFPYETIEFTTSGIHLTEQNIEKLAHFNPIFLQFSLNSANPDVRRRIMKDKNPAIAINAIKLLKEYNILFAGNIVAWPTIDHDDIIRTIFYLDENKAVSIKINLPSYSRFFPVHLQFDFNVRLWDNLVQLIEEIQSRISTPIAHDPFLFRNSAIEPVITGVIQNSPAHKSGLRHHDIITEIDNTPILYREQARMLLIERNENDTTREVCVRRNGEIIKVKLVDSSSCYPYSTPFHTRIGESFGVFLNQGFELTNLKKIKNTIIEFNARTVLIMCSVLLYKEVKSLVSQIGEEYFPSCLLDFAMVKNHYFAGNIIIGDLLVVEDFITGIKQYLLKMKRPDLIIIPGSSFRNEIDLVGRSFNEIQKEVNVQVVKIDVERIYY